MDASPNWYCPAQRRIRTDLRRVRPDRAGALLYRVPVDGARSDFVAVTGVPPDQFSLHAGGRFQPATTDRSVAVIGAKRPRSLFDIRLVAGNPVEEVPANRYTRYRA